jgi:hypothetical protein
MELNNNELLKRIEIEEIEEQEVAFTSISDNLLTRTSLLVNKLLSLGKIDLDKVEIKYWTEWNEIDFILYENDSSLKLTFYVLESRYVIVKVTEKEVKPQFDYYSIDEIDFEEIFNIL